MTGIAVGVFAGILLGLVAGLWAKPSMMFMQLFGVAGALIGALAEGVRFWWRRRQRQPSQGT